MFLVCECESPDCLGRLEVPRSLYDEVRSDVERFLVIADHVDEDVERVAANDGYAIVRVRSLPASLDSSPRP